MHSILTLPREKTTSEVLDQIAANEGSLSRSTIISIMQGLVFKRDHVRFGDTLAYYKASDGDCAEGINVDSSFDMQCDKEVYYHERNRVQSTAIVLANDFVGESSPDSARVSIKKETVSRLEITDDKQKKVIDVGVLLLLVYSVQQMNPKKRLIQSAELLRKVERAKFDQEIVDVLTLSIDRKSVV